MSVGLFFISLFLVLRLRRIHMAAHGPSPWTRFFAWAPYGVVGLMLVELLLGQGDEIPWIYYGIFLLLSGLVYGRKEFHPARPLMWAVLPFVLISFFSDSLELLLPERYQSLRLSLEVANNFAVVWLFVMAFVVHRQQKALEKERAARLQDEEQQRQLARRRAELEALVNERTQELRLQKEELEQALRELRATQDKLVQQEKLASLGELTAGIAHEIQNPLHFVTNFSEVSTELVEELKEEIAADHKEEVLALAADLEQNLQKIHHHGKRADAIVKNMLQHSRATSGEKQLTNLNALSDEYLRLAFHGLRAKDPSFTCTLHTNFDPKVEQVEVVPQDLGRVLLNLFNNAFYAVQQKQKLVPVGANGEEEFFAPTVTVSTHQQEGQVEIIVRDNGTGMPENVKQKVFQPFFTTKPTGEGTGLGLSLSYDIVTKVHGGELKVESEENKFTEFKVELPLPKA